MKATVEETQETETYSINGAEVPLQTWLGTTDQGTKIELLVFAVIPARVNPHIQELPHADL